MFIMVMGHKQYFIKMIILYLYQFIGMIMGNFILLKLALLKKREKKIQKDSVLI